MALRRPGDKPFSEPMIVFWRIYSSVGLNELSYPCTIVVRWMPQNSTDDKSTLIQVKAWCRSYKLLLEPKLTQISVAIWRQ